MTRITTYFLALSLIAVTLVATGAHAQRGARTAPRTLDQLTREAATIVRGSVVSAKVEPHPQFSNLTTVLVTLQVQETLKGTPAKTLQFRQYIWDIRDRLDAARYHKRGEVLLMLGPVSQYGLRSPVGLEQGRFVITRDSAGNATAVNGAGNVGLLATSESQLQKSGVKLSARTSALIRTQPKGRIALTDLEEAIRNFAAGGAQ
jgi:hypothetical protein